MHISGPVRNANLEHATFDIEASQYVSSLKTKRNNEGTAVVGLFPVRFVFSNSPRFKNKKATPRDGNYVTIEGSLINFVIGANEDYPHHFTVEVDNITFLGRANITPPKHDSPGK